MYRQNIIEIIMMTGSHSSCVFSHWDKWNISARENKLSPINFGLTVSSSKESGHFASEVDNHLLLCLLLNWNISILVRAKSILPKVVIGNNGITTTDLIKVPRKWNYE